MIIYLKYTLYILIAEFQYIQRNYSENDGKKYFYIYFYYICIKHNNIYNIYIYIDEEIYNNPNLHSEDQDELEIPEGN
jgi:hypothetical protein